MSYISVHPCDLESKGGCTHMCEKKGDEAVCKCPPITHVLDKKDLRTCNKGIIDIYGPVWILLMTIADYQSYIRIQISLPSTHILYYLPLLGYLVLSTAYSAILLKLHQ